MSSRIALTSFPRILMRVGGAVATAYLLLLGYTRLMRIRWVSDRTRQFTKWGNQFSREFAGTRLGMVYFNLSALHHVGRRSGRPYVTPVSAYPLDDGFVLGVAYPYVDWCENVLAAGKCTLTFNGKDYPLERPELIPPSAALKAYPLLVRPLIMGAMNRFLWLHRPAPQQP